MFQDPRRYARAHHAHIYTETKQNETVGTHGQQGAFAQCMRMCTCPLTNTDTHTDTDTERERERERERESEGGGEAMSF